MASNLESSSHLEAGCGLFTGIGGWVVVLDALAGATNDESDRELARAVLATVAAAATRDASGLHWHGLSEILWGTAGIGCLKLTLGEFFLDLYRLERRPDDLAFAVTMVDDILQRGVRDSAGLRWSNVEHRAEEPVLPPETTYLQGAAGIGSTLLRLRRILQGRPVGAAVAACADVGTAAWRAKRRRRLHMTPGISPTGMNPRIGISGRAQLERTSHHCMHWYPHSLSEKQAVKVGAICLHCPV